jgi:hypothetical protein
MASPTLKATGSSRARDGVKWAARARGAADAAMVVVPAAMVLRRC